jgi:NAD(P)-dependent dehydrogenase (short-subunit alcohol dehydrogenase family)
MKVERGQAALITGGGIGRALAVALAKQGVQVSVLNLAPAQGEETMRAVTDEHARISYKPTTPSVIFIQCDVSKTGVACASVRLSRPSVTSDKVRVRPIRVNVLLTLDRVNLDLPCPQWLPHRCHVGWSGLLQAYMAG